MKTKFLFALLSILLIPLGLSAQNVTVHPGNGNMLPALKSGNTDTFYGWGGFATWKHEQLSLTMTSGDSDNNTSLTATGHLEKPANDIFATSGTGTRYLQLGKGRNMNTYLTFALPKGYRFTGYTITFHRINRPSGTSGSVDETSQNISFGETNNSFTYRTTTNSTDANITPYYGGIAQNSTTQHKIGRTSQTETDMSNILYFQLYSSGSYRAFIQFDHIELYFTAEHNTATLIPATPATNQSAVDIPFTTSKIDYGVLTMRDVNGRTPGQSGYNSSTARISYDGTIREMNANMTLYEKGSTETITAGSNDFDGTFGEIVKYQSGSISSQGDYFKLESSNHRLFKDEGEAIYYIESPIWAINSAAANAHKNPIGYRIVSATINYGAGSGEVYLPATFKIQYESEGHGPDQDGTYGLNVYNGQYNWNPSYHTVWRIDQDGFIYGYNTSNNTTYYLTVNGTDIERTTTKPSAANGAFEVVNNQIRLKSNTTQYFGWKETVTGTYTDDNGVVNDQVTRDPVLVTDEDHRSTYIQLSPATTGTHGEYTLKIYGPDGTTAVETINVGASEGSVTVTGYNNDAIKIGIIGTGLINAQVEMQALDPYIDRLSIVCQENSGTGGKVTQQFNASDFSVKGGAFTFYVPTDFQGDAKFTFENLYSQYGDNTYYGETNSTDHARYFFVGSEYGDSYDNVYDRYDNNRDASYTTKIACLQPGTEKYLSNNAATASTTNNSYFEEYAFSKALYQSKVSGTFEDFIFPSGSMNGTTTKTAYLFTCDEPRYNIAPTTATQHVYYAYYQMDIKMEKKDYVPVLAWEKVYNNTFGAANQDSKWGLKLSTTETVDDNGRHSGYLTVTQILNKIAQRTGDNTVTGGPKTTDQILYVDASDLMGIVENETATTTGGSTTYTPHPTSELMNLLDENALIYLPFGSKPTADNYAYNTIAQYSATNKSFRAASNIVITDKYPFYAPYDIQVDAANKAEYKRLVTIDKYGKVQNASLILPFEIALVDGTHTNPDGTTFSLHTMQSSKALRVDDDKVVAFFPPLSNVEKADANKPYLVQLSANSSEDNVSFVVVQNGGNISNTTAMATSDYTFSGAASTGVTAGAGQGHGTFTFTPKGTYSGQQVPKANNIFYFANDIFVSSLDYVFNAPINVLPFRAYYATQSSGARLDYFTPVFEEGEGDVITAIIPVSAVIDVNAPVYDLQGRKVANSYSEAESLQSGIYVINGVKVSVK